MYNSYIVIVIAIVLVIFIVIYIYIYTQVPARKGPSSCTEDRSSW